MMELLRDPHKTIWKLAAPYLNTRSNDLHTEVSTKMALILLEGEEGDEDIVVPAIILHDTGWIRVSEEDQLRGSGPNANAPEVTLHHEKEGAKIAREILEKVGYAEDKIAEIALIIDGHDSREEALSQNDKLVKDADKLSRYNEGVLEAWSKKLELPTPVEALQGLADKIELWFFTDTAKQIARENINKLIDKA